MNDKLRFAALGLALVVTWSSGFVGLRFATLHAPVCTVLFWRCLVSGLLLLPLALSIGKRMSLRAIAEQSVYGVLTMFIYLAGFTLAIDKGVPTGLVALIADLVPLFIAALSFPVLGTHLTQRQWLGTFIGMLGVLVVSGHSFSTGHAPVYAYALAVGGMLSFALATVLQKRFAATQLPIHQTLCIQCLAAALLFGFAAGWQNISATPASPAFITGILWLVFFATFACYTIYYLCLRIYPAAQVASLIYLSPPVTMLWAALMFGEPLSFLMAAGLLITLGGVYLASVPKRVAV